MKWHFLIFAFISLQSVAQHQPGIIFEKNSNWSAIIQKAKLENKFIFVDLYTTWCLPCKLMADKIFPQSKVGSFFNPTFINISVQADSTKADDEHVKQWYRDAQMLVTKYNISAYPTYLFFNPEGELVHTLTGATLDAEEFIGKAAKALVSHSQLSTLKKQFIEGNRDSAFLNSLMHAALEANDGAAPAYINAYLATQRNLYTSENISLIARGTKHSSDIGFSLLVTYPAEIKSSFGEADRKYLLNKIAFDEEIFPAIMPHGKITEYGGGMTVYGGGKTSKHVNWNRLHKNISGKYAELTDFIILNGKLKYFLWSKDWNSFNQTMKDYVANNNELDTGFVRSMAGKLMSESNNIRSFTNALIWTSLLNDNTDNPENMRTFGMLLYMAGKKNCAIAVMEKCRTLLANPDESLEETILKMKEGRNLD